MCCWKLRHKMVEVQLLILLIACGLAFSSAASSQAVSVGITGGVPLTQAFNAVTDPNFPNIANLATVNFPPSQNLLTSATERTLPYTVGPYVEIHLVGPLSAKLGALYSRATYDYQDVVFISPDHGTEAENVKRAESRWEFPAVLKWRFPAVAWMTPYVTGGMSIGYNRNYEVGGLFTVYQGLTAGFPQPFTQFKGGPSSRSIPFGPTFSGGLQFGKRRIKPSVEFRYTRWTNQSAPPFAGYVPAAPTIRAIANQTQVLAGISF